jgi:hypothetical protein
MIRNLIRALAIVLIFLPEPITTAIGIALLSATAAKPGQKRLSKFGDPENLINKSLVNVNQVGFSRNSHLEKTDYQTCNWFDNRRISEKVLHHTLRTSLPQYEASSGISQIGSSSLMLPETIKDIQTHVLKESQVPQKAAPVNSIANESKIGWISSGKVVHHTLRDLPA